MGTIVHTRVEGDIVEFASVVGMPVPIITLFASDIRLATDREIELEMLSSRDD